MNMKLYNGTASSGIEASPHERNVKTLATSSFATTFDNMDRITMEISPANMQVTAPEIEIKDEF